MYNYYADTVWAVNIALAFAVLTTCVVILLTAVIKNYFWSRRGQALIDIKKDIYEFILSHKKSADMVCPAFIDSVTPQQFIDIKTNRRIDAAFFNESEQSLLKHCFVKPEDATKLEHEALKSRNKWRKIEAILCLGYTGVKSSVDILSKIVSSKDRDISYFSIISLGQINTIESARVLLNFLKKDPSMGYKIAAVLENFPKDIASDVFKLTDYHDPMVRYWALVVLSKFASVEHIKKLEKMTEDMTPEIRAMACECLGNTSSHEAKRSLIRCIKDDNWLVRSRAVYALGKIMKDAAIKEVADLINDPSWIVLDAVKSVMTDHIIAAIPYIEKFLYGDYEIAKKYSVLALQDSGYMDKLLKDVIAGKADAVKILKGVIKSKFHSGLDAALNNFEPIMREKVLEIIMKD